MSLFSEFNALQSSVNRLFNDFQRGFMDIQHDNDLLDPLFMTPSALHPSFHHHHSYAPPITPLLAMSVPLPLYLAQGGDGDEMETDATTTNASNTNTNTTTTSGSNEEKKVDGNSNSNSNAAASNNTNSMQVEKNRTGHGKQKQMQKHQQLAQRKDEGTGLTNRQGLGSRFGDLLPYQSLLSSNRINVNETENEYIVNAEMPGIPKENVSVEIHNGVLTLKGKYEIQQKSKSQSQSQPESKVASPSTEETKSDSTSASTSTPNADSNNKSNSTSTKSTKDDVAAAHGEHSHYEYRSVQKSLRLPPNIDTTKINAKYEHGLLTLNLPKLHPKLNAAQPLQIKID